MLDLYFRCPRELLEKLAEDAVRSASAPPSARPTSAIHAHQSSRAGQGRVGPLRFVRHAVGHLRRSVCPRDGLHAARALRSCIELSPQVARQSVQRQRASCHQMRQRHRRWCTLLTG
jgi:hypothetical protein